MFRFILIIFIQLLLLSSYLKSDLIIRDIDYIILKAESGSEVVIEGKVLMQLDLDESTFLVEDPKGKQIVVKMKPSLWSKYPFGLPVYKKAFRFTGIVSKNSINNTYLDVNAIFETTDFPLMSEKLYNQLYPEIEEENNVSEVISQQRQQPSTENQNIVETKAPVKQPDQPVAAAPAAATPVAQQQVPAVAPPPAEEDIFASLFE